MFQSWSGYHNTYFFFNLMLPSCSASQIKEYLFLSSPNLSPIHSAPNNPALNEVIHWQTSGAPSRPLLIRKFLPVAG